MPRRVRRYRALAGSVLKSALIVFGLDSAGMSRPSLEGVMCSQETDMEAIAIVLTSFVAIFLAMFLPLILSGEQWRAAEERAHARRLADARMNARLLRLNI